MAIKSPLTKDKDEHSDSLIERIESNIRHWPTSINKKLAHSLGTTSFLSNYLNFFEVGNKPENEYLAQCRPLNEVYSRLNKELNQETFVGDWITIDQRYIDDFAKVTGDFQWIHTDPQRASLESPFKTTIAQGFLTLSLIPKLTNSIDPNNTIYPEARMVVNYGLRNVLFPYPVKVGKKVRARTRVTKLVPMKRGLEIVREVKIEIENVSRPACIAETILRLYF